MPGTSNCDSSRGPSSTAQGQKRVTDFDTHLTFLTAPSGAPRGCGAARCASPKVGIRPGRKVTVDNEGIPGAVPRDISLSLFRVMQEGLHNAAKHSGVRVFEVKLHGSPAEIHLIVRDSGVGFDPELVKETQGLGLISMKERVRLVNGTLSIASRPKSGTQINVRVPLSAGESGEQAQAAGA